MKVAKKKPTSSARIKSRTNRRAELRVTEPTHRRLEPPTKKEQPRCDTCNRVLTPTRVLQSRGMKNGEPRMQAKMVACTFCAN